MTAVTTRTKRRAAIEKRPRALTLITGGTGFLGSHLVRQLVEEGVKDVRVMATPIPDWLVDLGVESLEGSITEASDVARAVDGISEVYHLAGRVSRERDGTREMYSLTSTARGCCAKQQRPRALSNGRGLDKRHHRSD